MSDLKTQLTAYFDAVVERVDTDEIPVSGSFGLQPPPRRIRPGWVYALGAAAMVALFGAISFWALPDESPSPPPTNAPPATSPSPSTTPQSTSPATTAPTRPETTVSSDAATLSLTHRYDGIYFEGSAVEFDILSPSDEVVAFGGVLPTGTGTVEQGDDMSNIRLEPGTYTLRTWQRVCGGDCSGLSPPFDYCAVRIRVESRAVIHATATVNPMEGCVIAVEGAQASETSPGEPDTFELTFRW